MNEPITYRGEPIEVNGRTYYLRFDLNILAKIQEHFENGIEDLDNIENDFEGLRWLISAEINNAIEYSNFINGTNESELSEKEVGWIFDIQSMIGIAQKIKQAYINSSPVSLGSEESEEESEKNVMSQQE